MSKFCCDIRRSKKKLKTLNFSLFNFFCYNEPSMVMYTVGNTCIHVHVHKGYEKIYIFIGNTQKEIVTVLL